MTLTAGHIETIRRYLGYPGDQGNFDAIAQRCAERLTEHSEKTVLTALQNLGRLQQLMQNVTPFAAQTFSSGAGGTQQYAPGQRLATLHHEANQWIDEIAATIGLPVYRRLYGSSWGGGAGRIIR